MTDCNVFEFLEQRKILSPVSLASRDQDGGPSNSTIDIYHLTKKIEECEWSSLLSSPVTSFLESFAHVSMIKLASEIM